MRAKLIIGLVLLSLLASLGVAWRLQTRALGDALVQDLAAVKKVTLARTPAPRAPLHDNGLRCLGEMLDVTPGDLTPFAGEGKPALEPFIIGARPLSELPPEVRARLLALSPWAAAMRGCGDSMQLAWVEGLSPWTPSSHPRPQRLAAAMPALLEFTALELRVLLADAQPAVALERCGSTWAMAADQSHLGLLGATSARMAVRRLAPACAEALAAVSPEVRAQVARQWAPLKNRLASNGELVEHERLHLTLLAFAWVASEAQRAQLPPVSALGPADLKIRLRTERTWRGWDAAMRQLAAVAATPGPARDAAAAGVDRALEGAWGQLSSQYSTYLTTWEETAMLLDLLADLAAGGIKPLPPGVTRTATELDFVNAQGQHLVLPLRP